MHLVARSAITANARGVTIDFASHGLWTTVNALGVVGALLVLVGLPAIYAIRADSIGPAGLIGLILTGLGWLFFGVFLSFYSMAVLPWLADNVPLLVDEINGHPPMLIAYIAAFIAQVVGALLLAVPFVRGSLRPPSVGYILIASAIMTIVGVFMAPTGPATSLTINLLSNLGPVLLMIAFGTIGCTALEQRSAHDDVLAGRR
jgi:hypothetical protein